MRKFRIFLPILMLALMAVMAGCSVTQTSGTDSAESAAAAPTAVESSEGETAGAESANASQNADALVIPIAEITGDARVYTMEMDGVNVEVLAVKASDGSIRTAFNACQVCYDSGMGYYEQSGKMLVCQNCGNRFSMDQVGITSGGCNPVPIGSDLRIEDEGSIAISTDVLKQAEALFAYRK